MRTKITTYQQVQIGNRPPNLTQLGRRTSAIKAASLPPKEMADGIHEDGIDGKKIQSD